MDAWESDNAPPIRPPRTATVVVFLAAFAVMLSWLVVYALTNALMSVDLVSGWPRDADPRPRWVLLGSGGLFGAFVVFAAVSGLLSRRHLASIDAISDAEDLPVDGEDSG